MQISINVNMGQLPDLARYYPEIVRQETRAVLLLITARMEKGVVEKTPRGVGAAGGLAGSIHGEVVPYGGGFASITGTPLHGQGETIELGRRPGKRQPPIEPLALWFMRKHGLDEDEARHAAFGLAKNIAKWGFLTWPEGARMFEKTFKENEYWIMEMIHSIPVRVAGRINSGSR